jgi:hypothetical protein
MRSLRTLEWLTECRLLCQPACYSYHRLRLFGATSLAGEARLDRWSGSLGCRDAADSCSSVAEVWDAGSPEPGLQLTSSSSTSAQHLVPAELQRVQLQLQITGGGYIWGRGAPAGGGENPHRTPTFRVSNRDGNGDPISDSPRGISLLGTGIWLI